MIAVFAAMSRELAGFERRLVDRQQASVAGYSGQLGSYEGKPVLLCRTGLGRRAESTVRAVTDRYEPWLVLSVGLGGALNPELRVGDLVLCETVHRVPSEGADAAPVRSDGGLLRLAQASAEEAGLRAPRGRSLTADRVVGEPAEKDTLHRSLSLDVVEMESYWLGLVARERGLPFLAARVILDELGDRLPELPGIVESDGSRRTFRAVRYALRHPRHVPWLLRTAASERRALTNLTRFLETLVGALDPSLVVKPA